MPKMYHEFRWAIIKAFVWTGEKTGYCLVPGRKYKSESRAKKAFKNMRENWDRKAKAGIIHPSWYGKFETHYKLIEIPQGKTLRQAVNSLDPEKIYYAGFAA